MVMCRRRPSGRRGSPPAGRDAQERGASTGSLREARSEGQSPASGPTRTPATGAPKASRTDGGDDHAQGGADDPAEDFPAPAGWDADSVPVPRAAAGAAADPPPPDSEPRGMVPTGRGNRGIVGLRQRRRTGAPGTRHGERPMARPATGSSLASPWRPRFTATGSTHDRTVTAGPRAERRRERPPVQITCGPETKRPFLS